MGNRWNDTEEKWDNFGSRFTPRFVIVLIVVLIVLGTVGTLGMRYLLADPTGAVEAREDILSGDFRIMAYQGFFNQCASIQGLEGQIDELIVALGLYESGSRDYSITVTNIAGVKGARHQAIAKYNQDALKDWTEGQFRDEDLPYQILDTNYPTEGGKTVCAVR